MANYALRRFLNAIPILLGITVISFLIIHLAPGSPLSHLLDDPTVTAADRENMMKAYGLDQPLHVQYWQWLSGMLRGDFGTSFIKHEPVTAMILSRLPYTLLLTVTSFLVAIVIAVPLGVLCALKAHSRSAADGELGEPAAVGPKPHDHDEGALVPVYSGLYDFFDDYVL